METITLTKKEYEALKEANKKLDAVLKFAASAHKTKAKEKFANAGKAFGILGGDYTNKPSVFYVSEMRRKWRA
jgi:hypothetical protein